MILKFYGKILFICVLGFSIFSCDKVKETPVANGKTKPSSKETPPPQTEDDTDQRQEGNSSPETEKPQNKDPVTTPNREDSTPDSTSSGGTEKAEESKNIPEDGGVVSPTTGRAEAVGTEPGPEEGTIADSLEEREEEAPQKPVTFPQQENLEFTLEQVTHFDFIQKGGSDLFHYYIQYWFSNIGSFVSRIKDSQIQESWNLFCHESNCSNGIDLKQMDEIKMRSVIKKLSLMPRILLPPKDEIVQEGEESVFFLQGQLAPEGWDWWDYIQESNNPLHPFQTALLPHITGILNRIAQVVEKDIKRIAINLPPQLHKDPEPFIFLGKYIKARKMDLHIIGGCEHYCASYLLPAAKTVYMEPYGYIYRGGSFTSSVVSISKVTEPQREEYVRQFKEEWLSDLTNEGRINFVVDMVQRSSPESLQGLFHFFQNRLKVEASEQAEEFQQKFTKFQVQKLSFSEWTKTNWQEFIGSFSPELLESLALYFRLSYDQRVLNASAYLKRLTGLSEISGDYYKEIQIENLIYQKDYSFLNLDLLFGFLLKDEGYAKHFSVPKVCYSTPEKDKPYEWIVPSMELLRDVGIDIQGENNVEMLDFSDNSFMLESNEKFTAEKFLYLDSKGVTNCKFFEQGACGYTIERLQECLSNGNLPQNFHSSNTDQGTLSNEQGDGVSDTEASDLGTRKIGNLNFPEEEGWRFTLDQIASLDFIKKGGSDLFHYYIQFLFNKINSLFTEAEPDADYRETLKGLCHESDCSKGLNLQEASQFGMPSTIRLFSFIESSDILADDPDTEESLLFLQGRLAPEEWDPLLYLQNRSRSGEKKPVEHIQNILHTVRWMEEHNVQRIAVNLLPQFHEDPAPFVILGEFMKKKQMDLHIMGGCGHYCVSYLIPAAKTVYIEPYGYIYHQGNFTGKLVEVSKIFNVQNEEYIKEHKEQWLPQLRNEEMVDFVTDAIISSDNKGNTIANLLIVLQKNNAQLEKEFRDRLGRFKYNTNKEITNGTEEEVRGVINGFSPELLKEAALSLKLQFDDKVTKSSEYTKRLRHFSRMETSYYFNRINIKDLKPQTDYGYVDFLMLSASLLKDTRYAESFSVPKAFYNIPEQDKPYEWIVPSAELLRSLGIDVKGENNREMINDPEFLSLLGISKENMLYLDNEGIENCGFFKENVSVYTTEKIKECLVSDE